MTKSKIQPLLAFPMFHFQCQKCKHLNFLVEEKDRAMIDKFKKQVRDKKEDKESQNPKFIKAMEKEAKTKERTSLKEVMKDLTFKNLSSCCSAPRKETHGCDSDFGHKGKCDCASSITGGVTWYYECEKCKKPC